MPLPAPQMLTHISLGTVMAGRARPTWLSGKTHYTAEKQHEKQTDVGRVHDGRGTLSSNHFFINVIKNVLLLNIIWSTSAKNI